MLNPLAGPVMGVVMMLLLSVNTLFWVMPLYVIFLLKLLTPAGSKPRDALSRLASHIAQTWAVCNLMFSNALQRIEWRIDSHIETNPKGQYLVVANHQTWNDIFVLMAVFGRKAPFFKFFLKQELIWVPFLGLAWWGLDYPFMKRSTPEQIKKNPSLKGKDIETTRKACEKYRNQPVLILNFMEGTRFTKAKQANQKSPYQHLLRPKAGGFAFALEAMGDKLHDLVDVTIAYPGGAVGFWEFMCGRMRRVIIDVRRLDLPEDLRRGLIGGKYESSSDFRRRFQTWLAEQWAEKDRRIEAMLAGA